MNGGRLGILVCASNVSTVMTASKTLPDPIPQAVSRKLGVLISGRGSNLQAIIHAVASMRRAAESAWVISNRPDAAGLQRARDAGIESFVLDHADKAKFATRETYDRELARLLKERQVGLVCLAGFMRLLT